MSDLKIGALAAQTGTNAPTIRYYEEIGLLQRAHRRPGGQRVYGDADIKRLTFIRRCREFGFSIDQVFRSSRTRAARACMRATWLKNISRRFAQSSAS
jgi:DNA-binding transcriptional MerR regulator